MKFNIDPGIFEQHRDLKVGVLILRNIDNSRRVSAVESLLRGIAAQRGREFEGGDVGEDPRIKVWYDAYGKFGINPKKFAPSIASLANRVGKGGEIPNINLLVDLYNYFSLKYLLPIGGEDIDWLAGDLNLTFTKGGEAFRPLGSINVEEAGEGEIAYLDSGGITCRYWNHYECERTKFTTKTTNAVLFVEDLTKMHMDKFGEIIEEMAENIAKYVGGEIEPHILTEDNASIDLGVEGRKTADDAKVPQQEKVFFQLKNAKKTN